VLECLNIRLAIVTRALRNRDKLKLLLWFILDSFPRTIERALHLTKILTNIKNRLVNKVLVRVGGFYKLVDSTSAFIISPKFEKQLWDYLNLEEGDVFVDVGSHIGKYTIPAARLVGSSGLVISVEPHPENYAVLVENVMLNKLTNVITLNIAA
jgi:hypothetical protein